MPDIHEVTRNYHVYERDSHHVRERLSAADFVEVHPESGNKKHDERQWIQHTDTQQFTVIFPV